jgi:hypothetical protein
MGSTDSGLSEGEVARRVAWPPVTVTLQVTEGAAGLLCGGQVGKLLCDTWLGVATDLEPATVQGRNRSGPLGELLPTAKPLWRPIAELTLTCDHRGVDGATGARFLTAPGWRARRPGPQR